MDRDTRWDRIKLAYDAMVYGDGFAAPAAPAAVAAAYARGETDEFVRPTVVGDPVARPRVRDGDVCLFFNFRPDRAPPAHAGLLRAGLRRVRPRAAGRRASTSSR